MAMQTIHSNVPTTLYEVVQDSYEMAKPKLYRDTDKLCSSSRH